MTCLFSVDEAAAAAIRRVLEVDGELSAIIEFRRHYPLITDHAWRKECVRMIASWGPLPAQKPTSKRGDTE